MDDAAQARVDEFCTTVRIGSLTGEDLVRYFNSCECDVTAAYPAENSQQRSWVLLIKPRSKALIDGFGLLREVLVYVSMHREFQPRLLNNRHSIEASVVEGRLQEDIEFVVSDDPSLLDRLAGQPQRERVLVPLSSASVLDDLGNGTPSVAFRSRLQEKLYAADFFDRSGPVEGRDFIGRDKFLQNLSQALANGSHIGLFGLRKMGKTSIIQELVSRARRLSKNLHWVRIDLLSVMPANRSATYLYHRIGEELAGEINPNILRELRCETIGRPVRFGDIAQTDTDSRAFERAFDADFRAILAYLRKHDQRLTLVLDEIEQLFPIPGQPEGFEGYDSFLQYIRGVAQQTGALSLMAVGVNAHISEATFFGSGRPAMGHGGRRQNPMFAFLSTRYAPPMELDDVKTMLRKLGKSSGVTFTHEATQTILDLVGGHPYLIRKYCSLLIHGAARPIEITRENALSRKSDFIRQENSVFAEMCSVVKEYYPDEFAVLYRVATEGGCDAGSINNTILAHLEGCQLVAVRNGRVELGTELLREWLSSVTRADASRVTLHGDGVPSNNAEPITLSDDALQGRVKQCEISLRRLARQVMDQRWGGKSDNRIRQAIGADSAAKADRSLESTLDRYYPEADSISKDFLDFLYIGDLAKIILGSEWELFRRIFTDKKATEHNLKVVAGCRNELQHFRAIPEHERLRAFVAIGDLLGEIAPHSGTL
jgi:hypothetical protein